VGNVAFAETNTVKAIGDNQLKRLQSEQGADDHLVETGQQQEDLPQATAPVVPDRSDNDPTCQRRHYRGFQAHGPGLYAVPSTCRRSDRSGYVAAQALRGRWVR
jgi:hypothetical protein